MADVRYPEQLVFGLDIGTRSIVGTVGYKLNDRFCIVAQKAKEHDTRAMLDGQIHDIGKVAATIKAVKTELELEIGQPLRDVCIAAAGRVLKTITVHVDENYESEKEINEEDVYALNSKGIEKAYEAFYQENKNEALEFYCVGNSVIRYYLNDYPMGNLIGHKAKIIGADLIATFLPDDVVDGLYKAVELADLKVVNLTLEPIAAIGLAIPEMYRMLNIALVDVGAGTSDISITKDGTIIAFGMIPLAGDGLTEAIAKHCLTDFVTAEKIKRAAETEEVITYQDIMGLEMSIKKEELLAITAPFLEQMTTQVADKIKELNGDKSVSAVFVVGGGGKLPGYTDLLAQKLELQKERVAVRGQQVMQNVDFINSDLVIDSLLVTPIGICLSFYEQSNNFIYVSFNGKRIKLYDNSKLQVIDAAMQAQFANEDLFPKRGSSLEYTFNGTKKMLRGEPGESASIEVNGKTADIHTGIKNNDQIVVTSSTKGAAARMTIGQLVNEKGTMEIIVQGKKVNFPQSVLVNGIVQKEDYLIQNYDDITLQNYYTVEQILQYMDIEIAKDMVVLVNKVQANMNTPVYESFTVDLDIVMENNKQSDVDSNKVDAEKEISEAEKVETKLTPFSMQVVVNKAPVVLSGKTEYVYVDVFDFINFDLSSPQGTGIVTLLNGKDAQYMEPLRPGDVIDIYWKK